MIVNLFGILNVVEPPSSVPGEYEPETAQDHAADRQAPPGRHRALER